MPNETPVLMNQAQRINFMLDLCDIVRTTGQQVLKMGRNDMHDLVVVDRHSFSNVDSVAGSTLRTCIETTLRDFPGVIAEECDIIRLLNRREPTTYPLLICDAVEGSTNAKRGLASHVPRPILAGTSVVMLEQQRMSTVAASAFYDFASGKVFSSARGESGSFIPFIDGQIVPPRRATIECHGDSQPYAVVAGYSNEDFDSLCKIMIALAAKEIRWDGGTRSSAQDLLNILCNEVDAYIDLRSLFPGKKGSSDEVLHFWDVGGLLPFLDGLGFCIYDHTGKSWQDCVLGDKLALIVSRPSLQGRIMDAIKQLPFVSDANTQTPSIPFSVSL